MKKYLRKSLIPFVIIFATCVEGNLVIDKNLSTDNINKDQKKEKGNIGILPFFLASNNINDSIIGMSLFFNSKPFGKVLFNMSANIATDYSFKKIVSKSIIFNVIYNVDTKSYISSDISISVYNFFDDYEYFSLFIQQSYGCRVTDRLLYNLGF